MGQFLPKFSHNLPPSPTVVILSFSEFQQWIIKNDLQIPLLKFWYQINYKKAIKLQEVPPLSENDYIQQSLNLKIIPVIEASFFLFWTIKKNEMFSYQLPLLKQILTTCDISGFLSHLFDCMNSNVGSQFISFEDMECIVDLGLDILFQSFDAMISQVTNNIQNVSMRSEYNSHNQEIIKNLYSIKKELSTDFVSLSFDYFKTLPLFASCESETDPRLIHKSLFINHFFDDQLISQQSKKSLILFQPHIDQYESKLRIMLNRFNQNQNQH